MRVPILLFFISLKVEYFEAILVNATSAVCVFDLRGTTCCNKPCRKEGAPCEFNKCSAVGGPRQVFHRARVAVHSCLERGYGVALNTEERLVKCKGRRGCISPDLRYLEDIGFPRWILDDEDSMALQYPRGTQPNADRLLKSMDVISWFYQVPKDCVIFFNPSANKVNMIKESGYKAQQVDMIEDWTQNNQCGVASKELKVALSQIAHCSKFKHPDDLIPPPPNPPPLPSPPRCPHHPPHHPSPPNPPISPMLPAPPRHPRVPFPPLPAHPPRPIGPPLPAPPYPPRIPRPPRIPPPPGYTYLHNLYGGAGLETAVTGTVSYVDTIQG
ncbi:hypothetical protein CYMTET_19952 [Cymbomonas tetramitiformis]|uniref:Uncharacterized protein n=1 Tax=Cymbomonas tetramitiformis TaxID=36881 RepID=A0AAE0L4S6_9CHLO|nr:hypothetical protein CYMTET_19952 [Cymbomonas tetramitiformis]